MAPNGALAAIRRLVRVERIAANTTTTGASGLCLVASMETIVHSQTRVVSTALIAAVASAMLAIPPASTSRESIR